MNQLSTKERIIAEASRLFAKKGYGAVNVEEIAKAVGIKAPSLYKHFKGKREIFDAVVLEMTARYQKNMADIQLDGHDGDIDAPTFEEITQEQLEKIGEKLFAFFLHDEYAANFRKLLTIEQFQDSELAAMYTKQYVDEPLAYQGMLFSMLVQSGTMREADSQIMALHFYAPIHLLLSICDRHPERETESLKMLERHIRQFHSLYRTGVDGHE
ncbi:TetR/AcrR family transcriptional regulator [Enterococcus sp. AZ196]|uniref:TetR/AcrR family transcriptional regulator n=1 Tax=Enterococcus sp. AZ196 TaxID=2774659 RepID=UPI003D2A618A